MNTFRKTVKKFTESQGKEAKEFQNGYEAALCDVLTTGNDQHWTDLVLREDGNGNLAWYVELHSCPQ